MIRLFRRLKTNLIEQGKLSKYLLYAVGEILLVVIGIILAVQINILIDNNNRQKLQIDILTEIRTNLDGDLNEIKEEVDNYDMMRVYDSALLAAIQQRSPFTDSLGGYAYALEISGHLNPALSGYELLKSKGIELVTDDSLRIALTDLYERWYTYYMKYEHERIEIVQTVIKPYMIKNFYQEKTDVLWTKRKRMPMNYDALMKDSEWTSIIQTNEGIALVMASKARDLRNKMQAMHNRITSYLDKQK